MNNIEEQKLQMKTAPGVFEADPYIEKLLNLRQMRPDMFYGYPPAVIDIVEQYEREKMEAAEVTDPSLSLSETTSAEG